MNAVVIVANGFSRENVRLQPWRYLYEIACHISEKRKVVVITDGETDADEQLWDEGINVVATSNLSVHQWSRLGGLIMSYGPVQLWWSVTPRSIAYQRLLKTISCEKYALITCPLYTYMQLIRAKMAGVPFSELRALWQQRLVPRKLFVNMLGGGLFDRVFTQSQANADVLINSGVPEKILSVLRVGIDPADRGPVDMDDDELGATRLSYVDGAVTLMYFGAVRQIRGFYKLLEAFSVVVKKTNTVNLVVLARGADDEKLAEINRSILRAGLVGRVTVIGGWLSREQVWAHIECCDIVVLPFVIVPSDVPIAILESLARGKPVIGSSVDGIPELIEGRGAIVDPLDIDAFSSAILDLAGDADKRKSLGINAFEYMKTYPDWGSIGEQAVSMAGLA